MRTIKVGVLTLLLVATLLTLSDHIFRGVAITSAAILLLLVAKIERKPK